MPDEEGEVTIEITLPQDVYGRMKRLAEDGVQDLYPMPANRPPTTAEEFVGELLIGRLRAFGITADSEEVQTLKTELAETKVELEKVLKQRVGVVQKVADVVVAAVVEDTK